MSDWAVITRQQALAEIDHIIDTYDDSDDQPKLDKRLKQLRSILMQSTKGKRIKGLLAKGQDLTISEIKWMLNQDVTRRTISKAMDMDFTAFAKYLENHGIDRIHYKRSEGALNKTEKAKKLLSETEMTVSEISKETGLSKNNLYYHASRIRPKQDKKPPKQEAKNVGKDTDKELAEIKESLNKLLVENSTLRNDRDKLNTEIDQLKQQNANLSEIVNTKEQDRWKKKHDLLWEYLSVVKEG